MNSIDLDANCRICLKENEIIGTSMKPMSTKCINADDSDSTSIILNFNEMLSNIITIDLNNISAKPYNICEQCELNLIDTYSFINLCRNTEKILDNLLLSKNQQPSVVYENTDNDETESAFTIIDDEEQDRSKKEIAAVPEENEKTEKFSNKKKLCRCCNLSFESIKEYQHHYRTIHREKILCSLCGKLVAKFTLDKHTTCHTKIKNHLCNECGKSFTLRENLKKHTGEKRYSCQYCNEKFLHWNSKRSHVRTMHTGEKRYECTI